MVIFTFVFRGPKYTLAIFESRPPKQDDINTSEEAMRDGAEGKDQALMFEESPCSPMTNGDVAPVLLLELKTLSQSTKTFLDIYYDLHTLRIHDSSQEMGAARNRFNTSYHDSPPGWRPFVLIIYFNKTKSLSYDGGFAYFSSARIFGAPKLCTSTTMGLGSREGAVQIWDAVGIMYSYPMAGASKGAAIDIHTETFVHFGFDHVDSNNSSLRFPAQYLEGFQIDDILTYSENISAIESHKVALETLALRFHDSCRPTWILSLRIAAVSDQDTNIIGPSEPQGEIVHPNVSSTSEDEEPIMEAISSSSSDVRLELSPKLLVAGSHIDPVDEQSTSASDDDDDYGIILPRVTISAFTETGQAEASIKVPKQRSYTGRRPVIPSSIADTPCATLGIQGVLDGMNATLGTSHTLDTPSVLSVLEESPYMAIYARREDEDREMRNKALVGNVIINPELKPRRIWDLYSNRVVPHWIADIRPDPISHAWVDEEDRVDMWTSINGKEWPVPIPKDASLNLIRIEMLNLGMEYMWLDVLCLRQKGGPSEDLCAEEWKLDVPTIGYVYWFSQVVVYLSGLGRPLLNLKESDLDSDRSWFRRAWTVQEVGFSQRIIAGDTPDGPMHAEPDMQDRVSTNPVDRVAGLALLMQPKMIPAYYESRSLEDAWIALVNTTHGYNRGLLFFQYPGVGLGCKKWRPTWDQVMMRTMCLPVCSSYCGEVQHDDETDEDFFAGPCIEKGLLRGLDMASADGVDRWGELVVKDVDGMAHTFKIHVTHQFPIPDDEYTLLCAYKPWHSNKKNPKFWAVGQRMPEQRFQKVSVFVMDNWTEVKRFSDLQGVMVESHNVLV
ncbi:hypothetical protein EV421DRAFT_1742485 [Armillaria borealis]|uniref:Heterokaryon incompatibility domain-containing protein n=1 Tax=Armillaria borealis TaxID=47425 RepID=A0AA39IZV8_9AGAR|nr:hypothetical protein EV421DRAFT_1742485 [Armillaria borealis]